MKDQSRKTRERYKGENITRRDKRNENKEREHEEEKIRKVNIETQKT